MLFHDMVKSVCGVAIAACAVCEAMVDEVRSGSCLLMNTEKDVRTPELTVTARDSVSICKRFPGEGLIEARDLYLTDSGFSDTWVKMLERVSNGTLLEEIRECPEAHLDELGDRIYLWYFVTNEGTGHKHWGIDYMERIGDLLLNTAMDLRGDCNKTLDVVAENLKLCAMYANPKLFGTRRIHVWRDE
jgi:hypothetical protein